ncbi:hypothetical protein MIND_01086800 [Mycena indigotica]|uniref:Uncharacterized protein n=1 Tax=Mycena indigotica TaxID=2126181 RepID=A0A8H6SB17_9AGAR|nr:uncharacterized protein MIND_01086800 [Mycena indigotica]KAF7295470.1 hypothetical protein MIND_01086800 [Mycena indigotica]
MSVGVYDSKSLQLGCPSLWFYFAREQFLPSRPSLRTGSQLAGKTAIITGSSTGLGKEACTLFLNLKLSRLILAVRTVKKGEDVAAELRVKFPHAKIEVWELEMSSYDSVQAFAKRVDAELDQLDVAVLNAAQACFDYATSSTGHERVIQVNYLSTFLLAILLSPIIKRKRAPDSPGRITIVGSGVAYYSKFPNRNSVPLLPSFDTDKDWDFDERYNVSKLLGHMAILKLAHYIDPKDVIVNVVNPGFCKSDLAREASGMMFVMFTLMKTFVGHSSEVGASTYLDAAVSQGKDSHGCFISGWAIKPFAPPLYSPEFRPVVDRLWDETLQEFEFAGAKQILEHMRD